MIVDGWLDWAIQAPGIPDKIYSERNRGLGLVGHSIVGSYQAALSRFMSTAKDAEGRYTPNAAASVMFILCKNGDLIQMYDIWSSTWTTGGREANTSYWAIEAEGGPPSNPSEPFTNEQVATLLRLFKEFEQLTGRAVVRGTTFREHGGLAAELGYAATACPSHRYDWFTGPEDDMADPRVDALIKAFGGQAAIDAWNENGNSLLIGYGSEQREQDSLEERVTVLELVAGQGAVPEHDHVGGTSGPVRR